MNMGNRLVKRMAYNRLGREIKLDGEYIVKMYHVFCYTGKTQSK